VLVAVLRLDCVASELRLVSTGEISLVTLPRVAGSLGPPDPMRSRKIASSLRNCIHFVYPSPPRAAWFSMANCSKIAAA
jgi:hypothetical protein